MPELNETHDPSRRSWLEAANRSDCDFPIQNLPFGVFQRIAGGDEPPRGGVAIGDHIVDLRGVLAAGLLSGEAAQAAEAACGTTLNPLMSLPCPTVSSLRARLSDLLRIGGPDSERLRAQGAELLLPRESVRLELPATIAGYTDFSCSYTHMGGMRGGEPAPIFFRFPIGYNGRASSIRPSGFAVTRPRGQWTAAAPSAASTAADAEVQFGPEPRLDFELEFAAYVGQGNILGEALAVDQAADRLFGYGLLNDWSARGIQVLEMGGLGPFLGKSFLTTISPWIVTEEALAPFRTARPLRRVSEPPVPAHLNSERDARAGGLSIELMAYLQTAEMRSKGISPARIVHTNLSHLYWTFGQMLAHHTSNGCNMQTGDLIASGTVSGPEPQGRACLAEINQRGTKWLDLPGGERRMWLEDGDELTIRGRAVREGHVPIGFGECAGRIACSKA